MPSPINILFVSTLFPRRSNPRLGIFVARRIKALQQNQAVNLRVLNPLPFFSRKRRSLQDRKEQSEGYTIERPYFFNVPKFGNWLSPLFLAWSVYRCLQRYQQKGFQPDWIDAQYAYPDGVAATLVGQWLHLPVTITCRGSDINYFAHQPICRSWLRMATKRAAYWVTVSDPLRRKVIELGATKDQVHWIPNGIDQDLFRCKAELSETEPLTYRLLSIGNLIPLKGHSLIIRALAHNLNWELTIIGEGPERDALEKLIFAYGLSNRVTLLRNVAQCKLVELYHTHDVCVLMSANEGMPNVILEALCCGIPVISTDVGGISSIVQPTYNGLLIDRRVESLVQAIQQCQHMMWRSEDIRNSVTHLTWKATATQVYQLYLSQQDTSHR